MATHKIQASYDLQFQLFKTWLKISSTLLLRLGEAEDYFIAVNMKQRASIPVSNIFFHILMVSCHPTSSVLGTFDWCKAHFPSTRTVAENK